MITDGTTTGVAKGEKTAVVQKMMETGRFYYPTPTPSDCADAYQLEETIRFTGLAGETAVQSRLIPCQNQSG